MSSIFNITLINGTISGFVRNQTTYRLKRPGSMTLDKAGQIRTDFNPEEVHETYSFGGQLTKSMDTEPIFSNYSESYFAEFPNSPNFTTLSVGETFKWTDEEIARLMHLIFRPTLIIVGTVGNSLTIYTMRRTSLKHLSTCFYMVLLALVDTSKLAFCKVSLNCVT